MSVPSQGQMKGDSTILTSLVRRDGCPLMNARPRAWHDQCALQLGPRRGAPYKDFLVPGEMIQGPRYRSGDLLHPPQMVQSWEAPLPAYKLRC